MHEKFLELNAHTNGLKTPVRNRYFYGKLMDSFHFRLETDYHNQKRWLINRLVLGYGVVCGLDVVPVSDQNAFCITPGLALDKWGREIIVPETTRPIELPQIETGQEKKSPKKKEKQQQEEEEIEERAIHVLICYHECETDPTPVLAGECPSPELCEAGAIREKYEIRFGTGKLKPIGPILDEAHPDLITKEGIDYEMLVRYITRQRGCPDKADDPCIPLANILLTDEPHCGEEDIDITIRPVCFSNDLLFHLILSHWYEPDKGMKGLK